MMCRCLAREFGFPRLRKGVEPFARTASLDQIIVANPRQHTAADGGRVRGMFMS